jgi:hypothetical protein
MSPQTMKLLSLLEDGNWHEREDLIVATIPVVPPGIAYRRAEKNRSYNLTHREGEPNGIRPRVKQTDASFIIATGARAAATESLASLQANGRVEKEIRDGKKFYRLIQGTNRVIKLINTDGTTEIFIDPNAVITTIDVVNLMNPTTPIEELEILLKALDTYNGRWPGVKKCKELVRAILNNRNVSKALMVYEQQTGRVI